MLLSDDMVAEGWGGGMGPRVAPDNPNPDRKAGQIKRGLGDWGERHHPCTKGLPRPRECVTSDKPLPFSEP